MKIFRLFLLCFFLSLQIFAEVPELSYVSKLTISEGLPHNGVTTIFEDSKGFIWIGTYDGLCKFDGYSCKIYKNTWGNSILISNRVRSLWEDESGNIWIGTDEGITIYDCNKDSFRNIYSYRLKRSDLSGPAVLDICGSPDNDLVICATENREILVFGKDYTFRKKIDVDFQTDRRLSLFRILMLDAKNYLFATSEGIVHCNVETEQVKKVLEDQFHISRYLTKVDDSNILVGYNGGVAVVEFHRNQGDYRFTLKSKKVLIGDVNSIALDNEGKLWAGTIAKGVFEIDNCSKVLNGGDPVIRNFMAGSGLLRASCVFVASNNECWAGTFTEGLYRFSIRENPFVWRNAQMVSKYGMQSNEVVNIEPLDDHRAFVTISRGGICLFNAQTNSFEQLPFKIPSDISLLAGPVFVDSRQNAWMRVNYTMGISVVKAGQKEVEKLYFRGEEVLKSLHVFLFREDKFGNIWVGAEEGVYRIKVDDKCNVTGVDNLNDHPFFKDQKISKTRVLYIDPLYDYIWAGTNKDGLVRLEVKKDITLNEINVSRFITRDNRRGSISSNFVTSILRLPNDDMWIGTEGGGICRVLKTNTDSLYFIPFTEEQGLSNNSVKNMEYDDAYNLWVSTNIGLNKFDLRDYQFRKYTLADRLPFDDFTYGSAKLKDGTMLFGGVDGLCCFDPFKVPEDNKLPRLQFGDFKLFNQVISPGDTVSKRVLLPVSLDNLNEIRLKYNENVFSIELISLHYSTVENHSVRYMLLPTNEDWIEIPSSQKAVYFNGLQPGEYVLKAVASNSVGKWTTPRTLRIIITPPFWKTTPAYLLYVVLILLIIYAVMYYILRINTLAHKLELEQFEKDKIKEVNAAKLRFFSNISHEIKTPLTIMLGPVKQMAERYKANVEMSDKLNVVQRQVRKISLLVDQVHDFQRAEAYKLKMEYSNFYVVDFLKDIVQDYQFVAGMDKKTLDVKYPPKPIIVAADRDKLEKIVNNLLSNSFKHTKSKDVITIEYRADGKDLVIAVTDTGEGIHPDDLPHIFERFYRSQKGSQLSAKGSGIGLAFTKRLVEMHYGYIQAESVLGEGSKFTVRLPVIADEVDDNLTIQKILEVEKESNTRSIQLEQFNPASIDVDGELSASSIFVVDDDPDMRRYLDDSLSNFFNIKSFANGKECLDFLQNEWPDLVVSDVQMPLLNGFELCKAIKDDIKTNHIPVVLLTACANVEDQIQGIKQGADAYIQKPFNMEHLVARIEGMLRSRKQLRERFQIDMTLNFDNSKNSRNDSVFLEKLYNLMAENLDNQELDLDSFARELYLNRTNFYQKVKALTNQTPFELLKMYRLKKAAELLTSGKYSVNEVFEMTGFKSRTHFSKLFKEVYHVTPGKYASEMMEKY